MPSSPPHGASLRFELTLFYGLAYGIAWLFFVPLALSKAGLGWLPYELSLPVLVVAGTAGPSIAASLTLRIRYKRWPTWERPNVASFAGIAVAAVVMALAYAVIPAMLLAKAPLTWSALFSASVFSLSTLIGGPIGEEPGWRGFALPRLQQLWGPLPGALANGVLWACWHLPLFLCKSWTSTGFATYLLILTGASLLIAWLWHHSHRSLLTAIAAHAFFNTAPRWLGGLIGEAAIRDWPSPEVSMGLSGWAMACLLFVATRRAARWRGASSPE